MSIWKARPPRPQDLAHLVNTRRGGPAGAQRPGERRSTPRPRPVGRAVEKVRRSIHQVVAVLAEQIVESGQKPGGELLPGWSVSVPWACLRRGQVPSFHRRACEHPPRSRDPRGGDLPGRQWSTASTTGCRTSAPAPTFNSNPCSPLTPSSPASSSSDPATWRRAATGPRTSGPDCRTCCRSCWPCCRRAARSA